MSKKSTSELDKFIGAQVRLRRNQMGVSQEKLGVALGLTFQQIQKYEKGTNRISVTRLDQIASALSVDISFFLPQARTKAKSFYPTGKDSLDLLAAFEKIESSAMKRALIALARAASENTPD